MNQKNRAKSIFIHNFHKRWPIFKILSLLYLSWNLKQNSCYFSLHRRCVTALYWALFVIAIVMDEDDITEIGFEWRLNRVVSIYLLTGPTHAVCWLRPTGWPTDSVNYRDHSSQIYRERLPRDPSPDPQCPIRKTAHGCELRQSADRINEVAVRLLWPKFTRLEKWVAETRKLTKHYRLSTSTCCKSKWKNYNNLHYVGFVNLCLCAIGPLKDDSN